MDPHAYAWSARERQLYIDGKIELPTKYKIKTQDSADLRLELEELLETLPQKDLATWAIQNSKDFLKYIDIDDESLKESIIIEASKALEERIEAKLSAHQLRQAGFLANKLSQQSINDVSKFSARVFAQAVAVGHMRRHAIVSSDYAIKVVNILYPHDEQAVLKEREKQIQLAKTFL